MSRTDPITDPITVTELNETIKDVLSNKLYGTFKIKGDVSNVKLSNNNTYLTLKDSTSSVSVVYWNGKIDNLVNGDEVVIKGSLNCFVKFGTYQIVAQSIDKIGIGVLYEQYLKLKDSFEKKGYFNKSIKKHKLPDTINSIGILTSTEGAALHDILYVLNSNTYNGKIYIKNCSVQGVNCPKSIKEGIKYFNNLNKKNKIDILIISRGGGSFEDLMGYSSKEVVKSIYKSKIYIISAVGHEIDNMLSDYAANYRAPTPSIAAEVVSSINKKKKEIITVGTTKLMELQNLIKFKLNTYDAKIESNKKILKMIDPVELINKQINDINVIKTNMYNIISNNINNYYTKINKLNNINNNYDNSKILNNGYTMIVDEFDNLISSKNEFMKCIENNQKINIIFKNDKIDLSELLYNKL